jgi:hypothetical protein
MCSPLRRHRALITGDCFISEVTRTVSANANEGETGTITGERIAAPEDDTLVFRAGHPFTISTQGNIPGTFSAENG